MGAPKRLKRFRFVKCSPCHLLSRPEVHLGSSRSRPTKSCCTQNLHYRGAYNCDAGKDSAKCKIKGFQQVTF